MDEIKDNEEIVNDTLFNSDNIKEESNNEKSVTSIVEEDIKDEKEEDTSIEVLSPEEAKKIEFSGDHNEQNEKTNHTLRVSSLYKSFGHKKVVRGIEFQMKMGEVLGLLGPNGAGKTTTFYMVVGFYKPTAGDVFFRW